MGLTARTTVRESQGRHTLYLPHEIVKDSAFPFKVQEDLVLKIDGDRLVVERARNKRG